MVLVAIGLRLWLRLLFLLWRPDSLFGQSVGRCELSSRVVIGLCHTS